MLLLFPCPGTIPVPSCWPFCQTSCYAPPLSGCAAAALSRLSTAPMTAPTLSCSRTPLLHHQGWVAGRDHLRVPSQGLHRSGHHTWQSATPRLTAGQASRRSRRYQAGLVFRPAGFFTFPFSGAAQQLFRSQAGFLHALDWRRHSSLQASGTSTVSGHCLRDWTSNLSSCRPMPELGGSPMETWLHHWLMVKPVGCTVSPLYSRCISAAMYPVKKNKLVLSYLSLCLLPHTACIKKILILRGWWAEGY
jgi:hypothetical protein